ncbi:MAG: hypothetical protein ACRC1K_11505, partial [Planctomycetia bacterium]
RPLAHPGWNELLLLHEATERAAEGDAASSETTAAWVRRTAGDLGVERIDPPPLVDGAALIALGLKPGPMFKRVLDAVRDAQLDDQVTDAVAARDLARRLAASDEVAG